MWWSLRGRLDRVLGSLWFVPVAITLLSIGLALTLIWADVRVGREVLAHFPRLFGASARSAESMLAAIAGSIITVASVTFSITMVAVSQAASQYSSRVLRNFTADRTNQVVLGVFVGVFTYCLVVLRTIRAGPAEFVPGIATLAAFLLAIMAMGFLIVFIDHIAESLQASMLLDRINRETVAAIDREYPESAGGESPREEPSPPFQPRWTVGANRTGYIQELDLGRLARLAERHDLWLRTERSVGDFVVQAAALLSVAGGKEGDERAAARLRRCFTIKHYRTVRQDVAFGIREMVDIALKALSPGVNNVTTAFTAVDYLSSVLSRLATRRIPDGLRGGERGRLIARGPGFAELVDGALDDVRRNAAGQAAMLARLLEVVQTVASFTAPMDRRNHLARHVEHVRETADRSVTAPEDRAALEALARQIYRELIAPRPGDSAAAD